MLPRLFLPCSARHSSPSKKKKHHCICFETLLPTQHTAGFWKLSRVPNWKPNSSYTSYTAPAYRTYARDIRNDFQNVDRVSPPPRTAACTPQALPRSHWLASRLIHRVASKRIRKMEINPSRPRAFRSIIRVEWHGRVNRWVANIISLNFAILTLHRSLLGQIVSTPPVPWTSRSSGVWEWACISANVEFIIIIYL